MGKTYTKSFNGGNLSTKDYIDLIIMLMKKLPQGYVCLYPRAIYTQYKKKRNTYIFADNLKNFKMYISNLQDTLKSMSIIS